jgi:nicotinate phosphoribosyltransferase
MRATALSTDLYQLTMVAGYWASDLIGPATFELYTRQLPPNRSFLIAAGLDDALDYLEHIRFTQEEIDYLRKVPALQGVHTDFFNRFLRDFRFTGDVWAVEEGTPVFPPEPLLRVTAPLPEAQLVETALLASIGFQTSVASRAVRMVEAASGRTVVEFGARRAHGIDAAVQASRAAFLAGCDATSNVEAGRRFEIPVSGTMAHAWVLAWGDERMAFERFASVFGNRVVLLLDTYETIAAAKHVVALGLRPSAVRLDSGDLISLSHAVRQILDQGGLHETGIFVSGDLDEWRIARLVAENAPVTGFGVGAALSAVTDAPSLGGIYKLVEIDRGGGPTAVMKLSGDKQTYPARKQIWRSFEGGTAAGDVLGLAGEPGPVGAQPLLKRVMTNGRRDPAALSIHDLRTRCRENVACLPAGVRSLSSNARYPVRFSDALQTVIDRCLRARSAEGIVSSS